MKRNSEPVYEWRIRVYYEDTDAGGVVFYANYLKFFERARTEWLRAAGVGQQTLLEKDRAMFVVKSTAVDYHAPARLDDELILTVEIERLGRASVHFVQHAWRNDGDAAQLIATGKIRVACVDADSFRPAGIPDRVLTAIRIGDKNHAICRGGLMQSPYGTTGAHPVSGSPDLPLQSIAT